MLAGCSKLQHTKKNLRFEPMETYVIFLRAVNVSGTNLIHMAELREQLQLAGFPHAETYIQSGNILVTSNLDLASLQAQVKSLLQKWFQVETELFTFTATQLQNLVNNDPFDRELLGNKVFYGLMTSPPDNSKITAFRTFIPEEEEFINAENILYFYLPSGMGKAKLSTRLMENKLDIKATVRNRNTILKMIQLAQKQR